MLSKFRKLKSYQILILLIFFLVLYFLVDRSLIILKKGYVINLFGQPTIILGVAKKIPKDQIYHYSPQVKNSFEPKKTQSNLEYREAKYEKNILINRVDERTIYATDAYTGEEYKLLWTKDSAYACVSQPYVELPDGTIDPSRKDLKGIKFFLWETFGGEYSVMRDWTNWLLTLIRVIRLNYI